MMKARINQVIGERARFNKSHFLAIAYVKNHIAKVYSTAQMTIR